METLKVGDKINISGPVGRLVYKGRGVAAYEDFKLGKNV